MPLDDIATYARLSQQVTDRGPWQQTATGRAFFLADPRPEEVHIQDVAHALSYQCRYNGHARSFYSIAQHAVLVSQWMEEDGCSAGLCYAGLHHDSAEAYTGDIVSQIKFIVPEVRVLEERVEAAVFEALGVSDGPSIRRLVKEYDLIALSTEVRDLLSENLTEFSWGDLPPPRGETIIPFSPATVREIFRSRHYDLQRRMTRSFDVV